MAEGQKAPEQQVPFNERALQSAVHAASVMLMTIPELRGVAIVFDWNIRSADLPVGLFRSQNKQTVTDGFSMVGRVASYGEELSSSIAISVAAAMEAQKESSKDGQSSGSIGKRGT